MSKDEVFFKFELDRLDLFHLSAILSAVAFKQGKVFEDFGKDADRLMRKLYYHLLINKYIILLILYCFIINLAVNQCISYLKSLLFESLTL